MGGSANRRCLQGHVQAEARGPGEAGLVLPEASSAWLADTCVLTGLTQAFLHVTPWRFPSCSYRGHQLHVLGRLPMTSVTPGPAFIVLPESQSLKNERFDTEFEG